MPESREKKDLVAELIRNYLLPSKIQMTGILAVLVALAVIVLFRG